MLSAPLAHAGEHLGTIECGPASAGRAGADRELLETLARQAALAIHNARLAGRVGSQPRGDQGPGRELAASRSRIVAAEERRGARSSATSTTASQQELVALIARIAPGPATSSAGRPAAGSMRRSPTCSPRPGRRSRTSASSRPASTRPCSPTTASSRRSRARAARLPLGRDDRVRPADARDARSARRSRARSTSSSARAREHAQARRRGTVALVRIVALGAELAIEVCRRRRRVRRRRPSSAPGLAGTRRPARRPRGTCSTSIRRRGRGTRLRRGCRSVTRLSPDAVRCAS